MTHAKRCFLKSCKGIPVAEAKYTTQGLENDRVFMIIDARTNRFVTARKIPKMLLIAPEIHIDESSPWGGLLTVNFPSDSGCASFTIPLRPNKKALKCWKLLDAVTIWKDVTDAYICESLKPGATATFWSRTRNLFYPNSSPQSPSSILSQYFGFSVHLIYKGPTPRKVQATTTHADLPSFSTAVFQDGYPLLVASTESLSAVQTQLRTLAMQDNSPFDVQWRDKPIPMERFRPNIVLSGCSEPFEEDTWESIAIGSADQSIMLVSKCTRCRLPNIDPITGIPDKIVPFQVLEAFRKGADPLKKSEVCFACNAVPESSGIIRVGDQIKVLQLLPADDE
ncbi:hypothetical protein SISNIDRAFT_466407 [Sistotremastrum niveocremeum HHB9708]|uniref:MOSC domain-containing protein n=2 Tax=Sistotremastraceae TaxID=3402574 RepID=A0A164U9P4_9AGAM|nr:hypothetical protein SISNIDRAFT_466407 [Sistotremastrum niveocremeum HHB9708]KZT44290.1 hypothetical protein SISSUDRAFT_576 [Sistotremastrum suecicum HHB10207 ss-3]